MSWKVGEVPLGRDVGGAAVMTLPANYLPLSELKAETAMELGIWEQIDPQIGQILSSGFSLSLYFLVEGLAHSTLRMRWS